MLQEIQMIVDYMFVSMLVTIREKLRKEIAKNRRYFEFNKIVPSIVTKEDEMDAVNKCLMESVGQKIVYKGGKDNNSESGGNDEIVIKGCDESELEEIKRSGATPQLADPN